MSTSDYVPFHCLYGMHVKGDSDKVEYAIRWRGVKPVRYVCLTHAISLVKVTLSSPELIIRSLTHDEKLVRDRFQKEEVIKL